jgi:hypothetical protein
VWTRQIKFVLNMDPEAALKSGAHPTPDEDLAFWRNKAAHLDAVFEQAVRVVPGETRGLLLVQLVSKFQDRVAIGDNGPRGPLVTLDQCP